MSATATPESQDQADEMTGVDQSYPPLRPLLDPIAKSGMPDSGGTKRQAPSASNMLATFYVDDGFALEMSGASICHFLRGDVREIFLAVADRCIFYRCDLWWANKAYPVDFDSTNLQTHVQVWFALALSVET
ncbi:MAG: hypothetical protein M1837_003220 [Sclerophora amabilis]|nr:MAG: hypothetical protein M1837_003220 [Sclerophora amabilis]